MHKKLSSTKETGWDFDGLYDERHNGIVVLSGVIPQKKIAEIVMHIETLPFVPKEHQHINNGQEQCCYVEPYLIEIYEQIRRVIPKHPRSVLDYSCTKYPISEQGAYFHRDFSWNVNCIVTFFFGATTVAVAEDKLGLNKKEYPVYAGDILIMRGPRDTTESEKSLRPIHAVGEVPTLMYAFEVREVYRA